MDKQKLDGKLKIIRPVHERIWKLHQALQFVSDGNAISSHQLRRLLGHCMFSFLLRRPLLSIFHHCYRYVEAGYLKPSIPWPSIVKECEWARCLLPMLFVRVSRPLNLVVLLVFQASVLFRAFSV